VTTVELPHRPVEMEAAAKKLAVDGISIEYSRSVATSASAATWFLKTDNPSKEISAKNK
jgi:hypothetical protein